MAITNILRSSITSFITRTRYRIDIITALFIKLTALFLLWALFFSHPSEQLLTTNQLTDRFISAAK